MVNTAPRYAVNGVASVVPTGVPGFDDVLQQGLLPGRMYLIEGAAGSGKTTLALQFVLEGVRNGERVLYVTLSETPAELRAVAASHGWSLDGIDFRELMPREEVLRQSEQYTMFHPSEVELAETLQIVVDEVERIRPARAVIDSLSELRLMAGGPLRYRRLILALKQFFGRLGCTVLFLDDRSGDVTDYQMHTLAHGIVVLEQRTPDYGAERRRLRVTKYRGHSYHGGNHDFVIRHGGLQVYPRLVAKEHVGRASLEPLPTGIAEFDTMLGGGLERGTSTLFVGATGTGKSSLASQVVNAALTRGESAAMFLFDESLETLFARADGLGIPLSPHIDKGLDVRTVDPAEVSPGEFTHMVRHAVEERRAAVIVIDSLNGYLHAMPDEHNLTIQLHELLAYLRQQSVTTVLVGAYQGVIGGPMQTPVDASYLADAIVLLRYFEWQGELRQAMSVVKKRAGRHERTIRELYLGEGTIQFGPPLRQLRRVFTGTPTEGPIEEPSGDAAR